MEKTCKAEAEALRTQRAQDALDADFRAHERDPHPPTAKRDYPPQPPGWMGAPLGSHLLPRDAGSPKPKPTKREYVEKDTFRHYSLDKGNAPADEEAPGQPEDASAAAAAPSDKKATIRLLSDRVSGYIQRETEKAKPTVVTCSTVKL